jgi:5-hydroxyisourate hydrolase-like protein (transthyretin family)
MHSRYSQTLPHILDLFSGTSANGVTAELFVKSGDAMKLAKVVKTDPDSRPITGPLLQGGAFATGRFVVAIDLPDFQGRAGSPRADRGTFAWLSDERRSSFA